MKNSKASASSSRPASGKTSGASNSAHKTSSSRQGGSTGSKAKQGSLRTPTSSAPSKVQGKAKQDKVEFSGSAKKQLDGLGLSGKQRTEVEQWHTRVVRHGMNQSGADHAKIRYLAHEKGSNDKKPHITASLKNKDGEPIKNDYGNLAHVYYDSNRMPPAYVGAVQRKEN